MALRWSKVSPQIALAPAVTVTFVAFFSTIVWTIYMSFTRSRRFPDYALIFLMELRHVVLHGKYVLDTNIPI